MADKIIAIEDYVKAKKRDIIFKIAYFIIFN